jgi:hypothetical protein
VVLHSLMAIRAALVDRPLAEDPKRELEDKDPVPAGSA